MAFPDVAKIVAVFAVVTIHVAAGANEGFGILTDTAWLGSTALETAMRWSVPLVMVSGMLLLTDGAAGESPLAFYRRRATRIAIPLIVWTVFYRLFVEHIGPQASLREHIAAIYSGQPYYHLYFLYVIAGLYIVCPFLARMIRGMTERQLGWLSIGALVGGFLWTGVPPWLPGTGSNAFSLFAPFVGYFLAGRWLGRARLNREMAVLAALTFVFTFAVSTLITYEWVHAEGNEFGRYLYGYAAPTVAIMTLCVFVIIRWLVERREERAPIEHMKALHFVGEATFGIFLIHPFFFELWIRQPPGAPNNGSKLIWWWPATVLSLVLISFACTVILKRIPYLRRVV